MSYHHHRCLVLLIPAGIQRLCPGYKKKHEQTDEYDFMSFFQLHLNAYFSFSKSKIECNKTKQLINN